MKYTLRQLEVFVAIARQASVSQAALALHMSQSAASMALHELEKQFDNPLFDRLGKRLQLNAHGQQILPHCINLLIQAGQLEALFAQDHRIGHLHLGASLTIGNYLAPLLIGDFMRQHKGSRVKLEVHNTAQIIQQVAHFQLDVGLIEGQCHHPDLQVQAWVQDELVVFAAPNHPLASKGILQREDLRDAVWILREAGSGTRQVFDAALGQYFDTLQIGLELEHTEAIKRAVEAGMGLGCVSRLALKEAFKRGSLVPLPIAQVDLGRQFQFIYHIDKQRSAAVDAFVVLCQAAALGASRSDLMLLQDMGALPLL